MQFLVIFILHIQRPKCSVVASSRKVIIARNGDGNEDGVREEKKKEGGEQRKTGPKD